MDIFRNENESLARAHSEPQILASNEFYIMVCIRKSLRSNRL